jgi:hypothetical protein
LLHRLNAKLAHGNAIFAHVLPAEARQLTGPSSDKMEKRLNYIGPVIQ